LIIKGKVLYILVRRILAEILVLMRVAASLQKEWPSLKEYHSMSSSRPYFGSVFETDKNSTSALSSW
jgi:hypothetical protein